MKLSVPVYSLKRLAKALSKDKKIPLHAALNRVAQEEGFASWSLLAARLCAESPARELLSRLAPGDLVLLGARPSHGKTLLGLEPSANGERFSFDNSDAICASYIIGRLASAASGTVVVIDYLQLLDQKRENPELPVQVQALKAFARDRGLVVVFISQIDRSYDPVAKPLPSLADVRLPNPLDRSFAVQLDMLLEQRRDSRISGHLTRWWCAPMVKANAPQKNGALNFSVAITL